MNSLFIILIFLELLFMRNNLRPDLYALIVSVMIKITLLNISLPKNENRDNFKFF